MKMIDFLMLFQHARCYLCANQMRCTGARRGRFATRDHVFPKAVDPRGRSERNILMACSRCNGMKRCREPYACEVFYLREAMAAYNAVTKSLNKRRVLELVTT